MASPRLLWVLWLLLWHAGSFASSGSALAAHQLNVEAGIARHMPHPAGAPSSGSRVDAAACGAGSGSRPHNEGACTGDLLQHHSESASLHNFVYKGDFPGFSQALTLLAQHENFPHLLGALQMNDAQGMTIAHLLACAGRAQELQQLLDVLFRMQGDGVETIRRIVLESRNNDACKGQNCQVPKERPGLYAHGTLHFTNPPQQVVLFGDVTPFECAAAHGHVQAMKLLVQGGVAPGKAFEVSTIFTLTTHLHEAIQLANSEGFFAQPQVFLPSMKQAPAPRQPRVRRKASSSGLSAGAKQKAAASISTASTSSGSGVPQHGGIRLNSKPAKLSRSRLKQPHSSSSNGGSSTVSAAAAAASSASVTSSGQAQFSHLDTSKQPAASATSHVTGPAAESSFTLGGNATPRVPAAHLSEALDIAALLLLTGMLLLPVWSTLCLLWRRSVRKRAAVAEPARRIKQAMLATGASVTSSQATSVSDATAAAAAASAAAASAAAATAAAAAASSLSSRKAKAAPAAAAPAAAAALASFTSTRQRKGASSSQGQQQQHGLMLASSGPLPSTSSCGSLSGTALPGIPATTHKEESRTSSSTTTAATGGISPVNLSENGSSNSSSSATYTADTAAATAATESTLKPSARSSTPTGSSSSSSSSSGAAAAASKQKRGKQQPPSKAHTKLPCAANSSSNGNASTAGPAAAVRSCGDGRSSLAAELSPLIVDLYEVWGLSSAPACTGIDEPSEVSRMPITSALDEAAAAAAVDISKSANICDSSSSKRKAGSQAAVAAAAPAGSEVATSAAPAAAGQQTVKARPAIKQREAAAAKAAAAAAGTKAAFKQKGKHTAAGNAQPRQSIEGLATRSSSAAAASGLLKCASLPIPELRALSADHAAQSAKAYAALIAPYTPSVAAAAAAARPALYQPPGVSSSEAAGSAGVAAAGSKGDATAAAAGAGRTATARSDQKSAAAAAAGSCASGSKAAAQRKKKGGTAASTADSDAVQSKRDQDRPAAAAAALFGSGDSTSAAAGYMSVPASTISITSAATAAAADPPDAGDLQASGGLAYVDRCFSGPSALSQPCNSQADAKLGPQQLQVQLSSGSATLQRNISSGSGSSGMQRDALLVSSSSTGSVGNGCGIMSKLSDAASVASDTSFTSAASQQLLSSSPSVLSFEGAAAASAAAAAAAAVAPAFAGTPASLARSVSTCSQAEQLGEFRNAVSEVAATQRTGSSIGSEAPAGPSSAAAAVVLPMTADAEVVFRPRGGKPGALLTSVTQQMVQGQQQQQQQQMMHPARAQELQALVNMLGQHPVEEVMAAALQQQQQCLSPEMLAQMANRWQQQQQVQQQQHASAMAVPADALQQQQQWVASMPMAAQQQAYDMPPGLHPHHQQQQQRQQPMATGGLPAQQLQHAATSASLALPAGMLALVHASTGQPAQQQHMQQQKLMVLVPQQQGVQLVSPGGGSLQDASPGQLLHPQQLQQLQQQQQMQQAGVMQLPPGSMVLSPNSSGRDGAYMLARTSVQQQQQHVLVPGVSTPVGVHSLSPSQQLQLQALQHHQLQQMQVMQLQGLPHSTGCNAQSVQAHVQGLQLRPGQVSPAGHTPGAASHQQLPAGVFMSAAGPGVSFVAGQRMAAVPHVSGPGTLAASQAAAVAAGLPAGSTVAVAAAADDFAQRQRRQNMPTASQQLLAMAPGLQQAQAAAAASRLGSGSVLTAAAGSAAAGPAGGAFDWSKLANELAAGPVAAHATTATGRMPSNSEAGGTMSSTPHGVAAAAAAGLLSRERRSEPLLSVSVPEPIGVSLGGGSDNESARMAAELDELLHQASQQLGWSAIPRASAESGDGSHRSRSPTNAAGGVVAGATSAVPTASGRRSASPHAGGLAAAAAAAMSRLKATAAEYRPQAGAAAEGAGVGASARQGSTDCLQGSVDGHSHHIKSLEELQLPDGFSAGD